MGRTLRNSTPIWPVTTRSESHLLVVPRLPDVAEPVKVVIATVVEVTGGGAVLLTTVVVAAGVAGAAAGAVVWVGFVTKVAVNPFAVAQYWE